jgi:GTPase SAR1 family protein
MTGRAGTRPPDRSETPSQKREFTHMHNATIDEELASCPWYSLKPEEIAKMVGDICDKLTTTMKKYASVDQRFEDLSNAAKLVKKLPEIRHYSVAVLGEQGIGKSSLINALLDRGLLDRSGSSKACTAYATIIEHKPGADDHTTLSDFLVAFFTKEEIIDCIKEQINRWCEAYPGVQKDCQPLHGEDENDPDEDDVAQSSGNKTSRTVRRGAITAKECFQIVFDVERDRQAGEWLERELYHTSIREGNFFDVCCRQAHDRLARLAKELSEVNLQTRKAHFKDIPDRRLGKVSNKIKKVWPFVKVVTITTGHILLRHGLRLFDLPGNSPHPSAAISD